MKNALVSLALLGCSSPLSAVTCAQTVAFEILGEYDSGRVLDPRNTISDTFSGRMSICAVPEIVESEDYSSYFFPALEFILSHQHTVDPRGTILGAGAIVQTGVQSQVWEGPDVSSYGLLFERRREIVNSGTFQGLDITLSSEHFDYSLTFPFLETAASDELSFLEAELITLEADFTGDDWETFRGGSLAEFAKGRSLEYSSFGQGGINLFDAPSVVFSGTLNSIPEPSTAFILWFSILAAINKRNRMHPA